jgi:4-hydroxy-tetrahydrodipicolinate reductase
MKIALLGYGKMGKAIEEIALKRNHKIVFILDKEIKKGNLKDADIAINFSVPNAAKENIMIALNFSIPVVSGTTGWIDNLDTVKDFCNKKKTGFIYASNFSIGVNIFFKLNQVLAKFMNNNNNYKVKIEETHHIKKLDSPSGTAISLANEIISNSNYLSWKINDSNENSIPILASREGDVPGNHSVKYFSNIDEIQISHTAHSREGFAFGALIAAEWLVNKKGVFNMSDVLNLKN